MRKKTYEDKNIDLYILAILVFFVAYYFTKFMIRHILRNTVKNTKKISLLYDNLGEQRKGEFLSDQIKIGDEI